MKKEILVYPAIFRKEENGYSVFIPDLQGTTCGETLEEAIYMAKDCIGAIAIEYRDFDKAKLPKASDIKSLKLEKPGDFSSLVELDFDEYKKSLAKSVKKSVSIPKDLNDLGEEYGFNFSQILANALKEKIASVKN